MFTRFNPPNRFDHAEIEWEIPPPPQRLHVVTDATKNILAENSSSDLSFRWSLNPYRGCSHACAYCYARAYHEYLGHSAGTDFERIIYIKPHAADLLKARFERRSWNGDPICMSGATDPYQALERRHQITRQCVEVFAAYRNPLIIITRSPLVTRDIPVLQELAAHNAVRVHVSIPVADKHASALEPGAPPPAARLRAVRALRDAGIPAGISLAPIVPGISDSLLAGTIARAADHGALWAWGAPLRLSDPVRPVFEERIRRKLPARASTIMARHDRSGGNDPGAHVPGQRMQRQRDTWSTTKQMLNIFRQRHQLAHHPPAMSRPFRRPSAQQLLF